MDDSIKQRNTEIKRGTRLAFIFAVAVLVVGQFIPFGSQWGVIGGLIIGTAAALCSRCRPEKGTLFEVRNRMTGTAFIVILGAFMLGKLLSMGASALLMLVIVNEENAGALEGVLENSGPLMMFLSMGVVTPFCEETVFRGCIGNTFRKYGIWFAMIMSSLLFALYHCNVFQLISTFLPGVVLFYTAMNYSIKWSMLLHFINNAILSVGFTALKEAFPGNPAAVYGEYVIEAGLIIAALFFLKKDGAAGKVRAFLSGPKNGKGVYKAAAGNINETIKAIQGDPSLLKAML